MEVLRLDPQALTAAYMSKNDDFQRRSFYTKFIGEGCLDNVR